MCSRHSVFTVSQCDVSEMSACMAPGWHSALSHAVHRETHCRCTRVPLVHTSGIGPLVHTSGIGDVGPIDV